MNTAGSHQTSIPFAKPSIGEEEIAAVTRVLRNGWLTTGAETRLFEHEFSDAIGAPHAIAVNSATAGLHLALEAAGIGPGDRVIVPTYTFAATAEVVHHLGAEVTMVDIDRDTLLLDLQQVELLLRKDPSIRAVIPVHFAGQTCDMNRLMEAAARHQVFVIEDAAHAFPATCGDRHVGTLGHATVFSFYATKTITTGEGGMVTTSDTVMADRMRVMRLHGISRDVFDRYRQAGANWRYEVVAPGFKYNMTDLAAAIGRVQLKKSLDFRNRRAVVVDYYLEHLRGLPLRLPTVRDPRDLHAWHLFVVQVEEHSPLNRDAIMSLLAEAGIGTSVHFMPLHLHPFWSGTPCGTLDLTESERAFDAAISLPLFADMNLQDAECVVSAIKRAVATANRSALVAPSPANHQRRIA